MHPDGLGAKNGMLFEITGASVEVRDKGCSLQAPEHSCVHSALACAIHFGSLNSKLGSAFVCVYARHTDTW